MSKLKIGVIISSTRPTRFGEIPAKWILEKANERPEIFSTGENRPASIAASSAPRMMPKSITDVTSLSTLDCNAAACAGACQ